MNIGIDIDGVLRDFCGQLKTVYNKVYPDHVISEITDYELSPFFPIGKDIYDFFQIRFPYEVFELAKPFPGAKEFVNSLRQNKIVIITNQKRGNEIYTLNWLTMHGIYYDSIVFTKEKNIANIDVLIDDCDDNLKKANAFPVCFAQNWNEWSGIRTNDYKEIIKIINDIEHNKEIINED